jgi:hypothetical protein
MSNLKVNTITDASGGNTATINGVTPTTNNVVGVNRIINGGMVVDQRNAGASVTPTTSGYTLDRWVAALTQSSKYSVQQSTTAPTGFNNSLLVTSLSSFSVAAGDFFLLRHYIEGFNFADLGWGSASAQTITLSFWVRSSLTGTFGGSLQNSAENRSYPFTYTISAANTWEQKTLTIAGDTSGTWIGATNGVGVRINFGLGVGSTYGNGTAGAWVGSDFRSATGAVSVVGTNGATFYITGVQLESGTVASAFERRDYGRELIMCQRYYEKSVGAIGGSSGSTITGRCQWFYKVEKRSTPTITQGAGSAAAGVDATTTQFYAIYRDGGNQPIIGNGSVADSEL